MACLGTKSRETLPFKVASSWITCVFFGYSKLQVEIILLSKPAYLSSNPDDHAIIWNSVYGNPRNMVCILIYSRANAAYIATNIAISVTDTNQCSHCANVCMYIYILLDIELSVFIVCKLRYICEGALPSYGISDLRTTYSYWVL